MADRITIQQIHDMPLDKKNKKGDAIAYVNDKIYCRVVDFKDPGGNKPQELELTDETGKIKLKMFPGDNGAFDRDLVNKVVEIYGQKINGQFQGMTLSEYTSQRGQTFRSIMCWSPGIISLKDGDAPQSKEQPPRQQAHSNTPEKGAYVAADGGREKFLATVTLLTEGVIKSFNQIQQGNTCASEDAMLKAAQKVVMGVNIGTSVADPIKAIQVEETIDDKREKFAPSNEDEGKCTECGFHTCQCFDRGPTEPMEMDDDPSDLSDPPF